VVNFRQPRCACVPRAILPRRVTRIYQVVAARDEGRVVGGEEGHEVGYLFRLAQAPESVERGYLRLGLRRKVLFQQRRGDEAGAHRVYAYPLRGVFQGGGLRQADDPVLGCDVGWRVFYADAAQDGRHVDDRATSRSGHGAYLGAHAVEDSVEVDRHHPTPGVQVVLPGRLGRPADTGVVDGDAQGTEFLLGPRHHRLDVAWIAHVRDVRERGASTFRDRAGDALSAFVVHVHHQHGGAARGERVGTSLADPRSSPGNDRRATVELVFRH